MALNIKNIWLNRGIDYKSKFIAEIVLKSDTGAIAKYYSLEKWHIKPNDKKKIYNELTNRGINDVLIFVEKTYSSALLDEFLPFFIEKNNYEEICKLLINLKGESFFKAVLFICNTSEINRNILLFIKSVIERELENLEKPVEINEHQDWEDIKNEEKRWIENENGTTQVKKDRYIRELTRINMVIKDQKRIEG